MYSQQVINIEIYPDSVIKELQHMCVPRSCVFRNTTSSTTNFHHWRVEFNMTIHSCHTLAHGSDKEGGRT